MARKSYLMVVPTKRNEEFIEFINKHNYVLIPTETKNTDAFTIHSVSLKSASTKKFDIKTTLKNLQDDLLIG